MGLAAAVAGAAVIGGVTSVISGNKQASAIQGAADSSSATQMAMYNQTRADQAPWRSVGSGALYKLAGMYGVTPTPDPSPAAASYPGTSGWNGYGGQAVPTTPGAPGAATPGATGTSAAPADPYGGFYASPSYKFRMDEGLKAIERSAAARGGLRSGATMKAMDRFAGNEASQEFGNYVGTLQSLAGVGQTATQATSAAGANAANQTSANTMAAGQARASSYANTGNAINNTVGNLASAYLYNQGYGGGGGGLPGAGGPMSYYGQGGTGTWV
jgi:hypothetical protein